MAFETRAFDGDAESLAKFVTPRWLQTYAGAGIVPLWTADYLRWQLPELMAGELEGVIAVYDGARLIGVLPLEKVPARLMGEDIMSTMGSWLTVDMEYTRRGVGRMLLDGMQKFNAAIGAPFLGGFVATGSVVGVGRQFLATTILKTRVFGRPQMWARVLNAGRVSNGVWSWSDALSSYAGRWAAAPFPITSPGDEVHAYAVDDLDACHALFERHMSHYDIAYRWDRTRLGHHLGYGDPARTLVLRSGGKILAFINFHILDVMGRARFRMAIADTLAPYDMPRAHARTLVRAALASMQRDNVDIALILGPPTNRASVLLSSGFMPLLSSYKFIGVETAECPSLAKAQRVYAHFR